MELVTQNIKRLSGIDLVRTIACALVIIVHVSAQGFYEFSRYWETCVAYDSIARMSVPLFFIVSGYLLFNKTDKLLTFYKKRFVRILIPFLITLLIYYAYRGGDISVFLYNALTTQKKVSYHLWFIYVLVGIYLIVPCFQNLFSTSEGRKIVKVYIFIWFVAAVCYPNLSNLLHFKFNVFTTFNFQYFFGYLGYLFIGGLLRWEHFSPKVKVALVFCSCLFSLLIYISTVVHSHHIGKPNTLFLGYLTPLVVAQATSLFIALKDIKYHSKIIEFLSKHTYWIYLIHVLVLNYTQKYFGIYLNNDNALIVIPSLSMLVFLISLLISIPLMKCETILMNLILSFLTAAKIGNS